MRDAPDLFASQPDAFAPRVFSVSEITRSVRVCLEGAIGAVWVQGEICNLRKQSSGHQYFGLKDERAMLSCVLFHKAGLRQPALAEGMLVQAHGELTVYEARGQYQLVVALVQPAGEGLLRAKFEALKRRLDAEGLFAAGRKKPLPKFPETIALVTSPTGAALRDFLNIAQRRAPWIRVIIRPARVQGSGAAAEIAAAIRELNQAGDLPKADVIVVSRGGGSAEDLWEFNEEVLARAIFDSAIPIVSAVGHEIDFTIADFVADLRAPTPSAAAELIAPEGLELARRIALLAARIQREILNCVNKWKADLNALARAAAFRDPRKQLAPYAQRIDYAEEALRRATLEQISERRTRLADLHSILLQHRPDQLFRLRRQRLAEGNSKLLNQLQQRLLQRSGRVRQIEAVLRVLSPDATLKRGYSITTAADGSVVRTAKGVKPKVKLLTRLHDGTITSITR